ncbi:hypothetical protein ACFSTI_15585 [Rhizorhabdus histidinilytica]
MTSVEQEFSDTPDWFDWAMAQPHERGRLSVEGPESNGSPGAIAVGPVS